MSFVWLQSLKLWDLVEFWDQEAGLWMEIGTFSWAGGSLNLVTGSQYLQMAFNVFSLAAKYGTLGFRGDERSRYGSLDRGWIYESDDGMVTSLFVQPKNGHMIRMTYLVEWTALDNSFCLEESRVSPPIDVYLVKTTMSYYNSLSTSGASPLCEWTLCKEHKVDLTRLYSPCIRYQGDRKFLSEIRPQREIVKEDTEFERTALSFYLHECSMLEHITKFAVKTTLDFYSSFSKNNASPLCEWVDDPHGLVNCWIELRVPNSDSFLLFTVNGYDDGFHLIESFAFTSLRSVVNLTLLPSGSIRQTGDRVFLSEILPQSDKEVSDENMRCETVKEGVVSEIVKEDLGNVDEIVSDREVSDENMRSEIVKKDLVKHANEIDEKMVSETVKEELVSEIVKEDLVKDSDEIDENRRSENVREDVKHADEITQAQHLDNVTKDLVKETADAQTDIEESVKECAEKATEAYLDRIRRQYIADQHKKRDELAEAVRKLTLETQQRDWEKQQKEKKEQRKLKTAQEKSKKDEQKKKKK
ncbi:uncharacterized protein LOC106396367 isoform X9 [Brassica napus]|uniref:uncharacterized protein LOC106396367 isoform X9 n=1 Tax=Brassica napus TaxID=3708 RepID=UPI00207AF4D4|nr:uncharacterized protein LOC106396367 isoform X9 [Brassica napus]